jgi:hypothetical protein
MGNFLYIGSQQEFEERQEAKRKAEEAERLARQEANRKLEEESLAKEQQKLKKEEEWRQHEIYMRNRFKDKSAAAFLLLVRDYIKEFEMDYQPNVKYTVPKTYQSAFDSKKITINRKDNTTTFKSNVEAYWEEIRHELTISNDLIRFSKSDKKILNKLKELAETLDMKTNFEYKAKIITID